MTVPAGFAGPDARDAARALIALDRAGRPAFLAGQPASLRRWCEVQAFSADPATVLMVPGADGEPDCALIGVADPADPHAPYALPPSVYRLDVERGLRVDADGARLGRGDWAPIASNVVASRCARLHSCSWTTPASPGRKSLCLRL